VSEGDGSGDPAAPSPAPATGRGTPIRIPCLHNPAGHEVDFHLATGQFIWIDLEGPRDEDLQALGEHLQLHPLTLDDARTFRQRPKIEDYDKYVFLVVFGADPETASGDRLLREMHIILSGDIVVTIHRHAHAGLDALRHRYDDQLVRSEQFLVYEILDVVISTFVPVLSRIDDDIDDIEEQVISQPRESELQRIFSIKRDIVAMRRVIAPMRDMFQRRAEHLSTLPGFSTDDMLYFRDLYDGLVRTSEMVDAYRDLLSGAADLYLSTVANRQGEVNRQLTIIATIFLPLTFFTGFFGQNFAFLTGHIQNTTLSFWVLGIGTLFASIVILGFWFRRRGWIGQTTPGGTAKVD
jgi:magnesium transporter